MILDVYTIFVAFSSLSRNANAHSLSIGVGLPK
jgi:hypothetical protein